MRKRWTVRLGAGAGCDAAPVSGTDSSGVNYHSLRVGQPWIAVRAAFILSKIAFFGIIVYFRFLSRECFCLLATKK